MFGSLYRKSKAIFNSAYWYEEKKNILIHINQALFILQQKAFKCRQWIWPTVAHSMWSHTPTLVFCLFQTL